MNSPILAIDPGMTCGWASSAGDIGSVVLDRIDYGRALAGWWNYLADLLSTVRPALVVIERPFFVTRLRDADLTSAFYLSCHAAAWQHDIPRREYTAAAIRKALMGRARGCTDRERIEAARRFGYEPASDHEADALLLLEHHRRQAPAEIEGNAA